MNHSSTTDHSSIESAVSMPGLKAIQLTDLGKRYNREWIFRHVNYLFEAGKSYAITGPNGSGKSTLLQAIAGSMNLSEGKLEYQSAKSGSANSIIDPENYYRHLSIAAPYLELVEEMTAREFLHFHNQFKPFVTSASIENILSAISLEKSADKQIRYFSSGMKQRVKLAQAIFSDAPVLFLDEPCTNLDTTGYDLYHQLIADHCRQKLVIVSSNDAEEMDFCSERLNILDYK